MQRDLRDPEQLGIRLRQLRSNLKASGSTMTFAEVADDLPAWNVPLTDLNPSCIEKYGRPDDVEEYWERIQIR